MKIVLTDMFLKMRHEFNGDLEIITIGRGLENSLVIPSNTSKGPYSEFSSFVSRRHCEILVKNKRYFLRDNGSGNGTFLNKDRLGTDFKELRSGDFIGLSDNYVLFLEIDYKG
jgi:pSer/pThr/pTyr-binding forkhead associated (FHA) protein